MKLIELQALQKERDYVWEARCDALRCLVESFIDISRECAQYVSTDLAELLDDVIEEALQTLDEIDDEVGGILEDDDDE